MRTRRPLVLGFVALLASLLALAHVQSQVALLGHVARTAVPSWDHPLTQAVDGLAGQSVPHADRWRETGDHALDAIGPCGPVVAATQAVPSDPALSCRLTRAPPRV
jgi:hypothetical protein